MAASALVAVTAMPPAALPTIKASTVCGDIAGRVQPGGVAAFRGVPYGVAARFMPPKPASCWHWNDTLDASADGPYCPGMHPPYDAHMSEPCLSLNVFTPVAALHNASALPIFVWTYGGSLVLGSVASYGPIENLVTSGRAMLVAMNYRLGALGFAALPELAAADPRGVSGNLGILDQQLALSWVANNAAAFGGDPSRVTLIGQSSGGTSILAHLAAPASRGLFHAAISLSASPNISLGAADKLRQDEAHWFRHTPCANASRGTPAVLACLRNATVAELQGALEPQYDFFDFNSTFASEPVPPGRGIGGPPGRARWGSLPYVDGVTITRTSMEAARDGYAAPLLLQNLEGELDYDPDDALARLRSRAAAAAYVEGRLAAGFGAATARRLYRLYAAVGGANETLAAAPAYALNADSGVTCGQLALARAAGAARRAKGSAAVYLSLVTARPHHPLHAPYGADCSRPSLYAFHLWDWIAAMSVGAPAGATTAWPQGRCGAYAPAASDVALGRALVEQWLTFAEHAGFPAAGVGWPAVDSDPGWPRRYVHGVIGEAGATAGVVDLKAEACAAWEAAGVGEEWWWIN